MAEIVAQEDPALRRTWEDLTPLQQRVLRAVAAGEEAGFDNPYFRAWAVRELVR